jgi:TolA-binding protein
MSGPKHDQYEGTPQRLAGEDGPLGRLLASAAADSVDAPPGVRPRVWRALQEPARPFFKRPAFLISGLAAACALVLAVLVAKPTQKVPEELFGTTVSMPLAVLEGDVIIDNGHDRFNWRADPRNGSVASGARISAGAGGAVLRSGALRFALAAGSRAILHRAPDADELWLESGDAAVGPESQIAAGPSVRASVRVVAAGAFRVEAPPGALFVVSASAVRSVVYAVRGEARVQSATGSAPVPAGASWTSSGAAPIASEEVRALAVRAGGETPRAALAVPAPAPVAEAQPAPAAVAPSSPSPARLIARAAGSAAQSAAAAEEDAALAKANALEASGDNASAATLLEDLSRKSGPRAEAALYELGRLRLRFLGQPAQALAAFEEHARRFPSGALALESSLSAVEARVSLGQDEPALREMDAFLGRYGQSERAADVRWLRASLLQARGDCRRALPDLRTLSGSGSRAEGALFLLATCARSSGDLAEARTRLLEYQRRFPEGAHRAEVDAALRGEEGR